MDVQAPDQWTLIIKATEVTASSSFLLADQIAIISPLGLLDSSVGAQTKLVSGPPPHVYIHECRGAEQRVCLRGSERASLPSLPFRVKQAGS